MHIVFLSRRLPFKLSAISKHFASPPDQPNQISRSTIVQPAPNWREVFEQINKKHNKSTRRCPAVSNLYLLERSTELKLDWYEQWHPDTGNITGQWNDRIYSILSAVSEEMSVNEMGTRVESCTELDSHANMTVVGKHAYIIAETGKKVDVSPFTPDYKMLTVPLVDATIKYDNPYNRKTYILVLRNALHVPSMDHNLIPPFMLREMGETVNDVPKIHKEDPTVDDRAITFVETGFRIPLSLWGIFSYFPTSKPTHDDLLNPNEVYILPPATWNPQSDAYSANEESMLDWEGNMQPKKDCQHWIVLDNIEDDVNMVASLSITPLEQDAIDTHLIEDDKRPDEMGIPFIPRSGDCVSSMLRSISNTLVDLKFSRHMCEKERDGQISAGIGSTNTLQLRYIYDSETETDKQSHDDSTCNDDKDCFDLLSDLDGDGAHARVDEFLSHSTKA